MACLPGSLFTAASPMPITRNLSAIRRRLIALLVVFPLLYIGYKAYSITQDYRATLANAQADARSLSAALNEHANRTLGEADRLLQNAMADVERLDQTGSPLERPAVEKVLATYHRKLPQVFAITVVDAQGMLLAAGQQTEQAPSPLSFADREYFQHHAKIGDTGLFISRPLKSRVSGNWIVTLSRSVNRPDGSMQRLYAVGIALDYFDSFYRSLALGKASRLVLVRQDGWVLMQSPLDPRAAQVNLANSPLFRHFRQSPSGSYQLDRAVMDGSARIIGYASSNDYPVLAVVSLDQQEILQKWRGRTRQSVIEGLVSIGLMLALIAMLWRRLNDLETTQYRLEAKSKTLIKSERRYQQLVDGIDGVVWEMALPEQCFTYVSANAASITGYAAADWMADPKFWFNKLNGAQHDIGDIVAGVARHGAFALEHEVVAPDGRRIWLRSHVTIVTDTDEQVRLRGVMVDNTDRKQAFEELELAAQVFQTTLHAIMIFSTEGRILRVNRAFLAITGFSEDEVIGRDASWFESRFLQPGFVAKVRESLRITGKWQGESPMRIRDGSDIDIMQSISVIRGEDGRARSTVAIFHDITGQKLSEKRLYQLAHFDALTQLPNRQTLADKIRLATAHAGQQHTQLAVLFIDIDHFKTINDSLGHETGDQVLCVVAERISRCLGAQDTVARSGGDEFVILLEQDQADDSIAHFEKIAQQVSEELQHVIEVGGKELYVSMSMGISVYPQDGVDAESLLRNADTAMYRAKAAGRNCWRFFDESMARHAARRLDIETALRRSIERNELVLYYQPQKSLATGKVVGVEALLRWSRPGIGTVPPLEFIPLAEESGLILPIGKWVLQTACAQAVRWMQERKLRLRIAVNIAAKQIHHQDFVEQVRATLETTGLPPDMLELEITESSIVENIEETVSKLRAIKALGVTVAIDDFGTGYSSLSYLKQLPIDRLKIDRSFVKDTPGDGDDCAIVRTIIAMSNNLGLSVIAEGVELQDQVDFLAAEGCGEIQGYWLSKPLPAEEIEAKLDQ
jgi:diguanylate cyclase (GGDEF)-like protein/PAS domain S-box-containing protein